MPARLINAIGLCLCITALLFAVFYLERTLGLDPCPLCMLDRAVMSCIALGFFLAALHNPSAWGKFVYAGYNFIWIVIGLGVAGRHIWLQSLPPDQVPSCGADFDFMWESWPLGEIILTTLKGSGDCAAVTWTFLGLSIPQQVFGFLLLLGGVTVLSLKAK